MDSSNTAASIQSEMEEVRRALRSNVDDIVANTEEMLDWRTHFRTRPEVWCLVGFMVGYFLVPSSRRSRLGGSHFPGGVNPVVVIRRESGESGARGWLSSAGQAIGTLAVRELARQGSVVGLEILSRLSASRDRGDKQSQQSFANQDHHE